MQRVPVGRTLLIAGLCALIPLGGNVAASFVTVWTGGRSWLVVPVVGVVAAMLTALVQAYGSASGPGSQPEPRDRAGRPDDGDTYRRYGRQDLRRGTPLPVALAIAILVMGGGGWALTQGVRYGVGYITGNEPGTERLSEQARKSVDGLTLTVESVKQTAHFTRVRLLARNTSDNLSMRLSLFDCTFRGADATTLEADQFKSQWTEELSPGSLQRGTVTFGGHVPDSVRRAELTFPHIFSFPVGGQALDRGPGFITVEKIKLRPP